MNETIKEYSINLEDQVFQKTKELSEVYERLKVVDEVVGSAVKLAGEFAGQREVRISEIP